jgi:hypothetical protein
MNGARMNKLMATTLCALLAGCATESSMLKTAQADRYRCENDIAFTVRFADNSAAINSNRGYEMLYRDAGGLTPSQTVFGNPRMRAEFGLGSTGKEAILRYLLQPLVVRCVRD